MKLEARLKRSEIVGQVVIPPEGNRSLHPRLHVASKPGDHLIILGAGEEVHNKDGALHLRTMGLGARGPKLGDNAVVQLKGQRPWDDLCENKTLRQVTPKYLLLHGRILIADIHVCVCSLFVICPPTTKVSFVSINL